MAGGRLAEAHANRRTDYAMVSDDPADLANAVDHDAYLAAMERVFGEIARVLRPGRYAAVIVRDAYVSGVYRFTGAELAARAEAAGLVPKGDLIWYQAGTRLRPYGYPRVFVPNRSPTSTPSVLRREPEPRRRPRRRAEPGGLGEPGTSDDQARPRAASRPAARRGRSPPPGSLDAASTTSPSVICGASGAGRRRHDAAIEPALFEDRHLVALVERSDSRPEGSSGWSSSRTMR